MLPQLFNYQEPHCQRLLDSLSRNNLALDASDLGTGKTVVGCHIAKTLGMDIIVTGKRIMRPTWEWWANQWGLNGIVTNWELARRRGLPSRKNTLYIFDEVHEAGGYKTLNARLLVNTYQAGLPILMLSATAIESPLRMWALGYLLRFHNLKDFYRWGFRNGVIRNFGFPGFHFNGQKRHLDDIHAHIFPEFGSRMRKTEIPDFPECQFICELVSVDFKAKELGKWAKMIEIRELEHEKRAEELLNSPQGPLFGVNPDILPEILFARMRAELAKVPALIEEARAGLAEGYSVVIFCNFLPTLDALRELGFPESVMLYGGQKPAERATGLARFQDNSARVMIATIESGGAGIDLHDLAGGHPRLALICPTWRATTLKQSFGRVHRAGGKSKSIQKLLYASGSIEEDVAAAVRRKLNQIDTINDSDLLEPELEYA